MKKNKIYNVQVRRKREGRTNYKKRIKMLISEKPRLVIRKSLKNIHADIVEFDQKGDKVLASAHSKELEKLGWKFSRGNLPAAYLVGLLAGKKAKAKGVQEAILDIGLNKSVKGSRLYAALSGVVDAGVNVPHDKSVLPAKERVQGEHIAKFAAEAKGNYKMQFSNYDRNGVDAADIKKYFNDIKSKIEAGKNG
ncbi:50S ribosomal protein L18 [Candidatus Woesearchaeota archaeon]|nr:50S ribosomal protein L18 [Candidatus Woesearchaeota archaeon]